MRLLTFWRIAAFLCVLIGAQEAVAQRTGDALQIPGSFFGTYDLTITSPPSGSIYADGTSAKLTLALDGSLCGDGVYIASPVRSTTDTNVFYWRSVASGLQFTLDLRGIDVSGTRKSGFYVGSYKSDGTSVSYGAFTGDRSDSVDSACDQNAAFFALAQQNYPELFPSGVFALVQTTTTEFSIYYGITDTYLIVSNGAASARGGKFGTTPVAFGSVKLLVADGVKSLPIPVAATPTSFDDYYVGTYSMTLQNATSFSPLPAGTTLKFVITKDYRLCAGETVMGTGMLQSDSNRVFWSNAAGGYYYQLKLLPDGTRDATYQQGSLDVFSNGGRQYGTFTGARTSLTAECADAKGVDPDLAEINLMFDLAEQKYPQLFPGGPLTYNQRNNGVTSRFYNGTGVTVEVQSRNVTLKGGKFGTGVTAGALDQVIANLQASTMPVQLPSSLTGTYALKFAAAGSFSPIPAGTAVDVAITDEGNLCMDGTLYTNPIQDLNDAALVSWKNALTGYVLQASTAAAGSNAVSLQVRNLKGELLGTLAGNKTLLLAKCAGLVGGNVKIDAANELFALAEQYYPGNFPASALTYNQLTNGSLSRYYPSTGIMISVTGDNVQVSGGSFGSTPRALGTVTTLIGQLKPATSISPQAQLAVSGSVVFKQGTLTAISRKVELSDTVLMPTSVTNADLTKLVAQALAGELTGSSTYTFSAISNTATALDFTVRIANSTTVAGTALTRTYDLRFSYKRL